MAAEFSFNIRAQDKTKAAFGAVNKHLDRFQNSVKRLNLGMVGGLLGGVCTSGLREAVT